MPRRTKVSTLVGALVAPWVALSCSSSLERGPEPATSLQAASAASAPLLVSVSPRVEAAAAPESLVYVLLVSGALATAGVQVAAAQNRCCGPTITYQQPAAGQADVLTPQVALNRAFNRASTTALQSPGT